MGRRNYHAHVGRARGTLKNYADVGEHEKLWQRTWAAVCFAGQIDGAWVEQENGGLDWGLSHEDASAIICWAAWELHDYDHATWLLQPGALDALQQWYATDPEERGPMPGPRLPPVVRPDDRELPDFVRRWNRHERRDGDVLAGWFLRQCRERAGFAVVHSPEPAGRPSWYEGT